MRRSLAARDIAAVFSGLRRAGVSQRTMAGLTGLAASEVYEVTRGRRVMSYDVLARLADGLGIPRGYLGLAYDEGTTALLQASLPAPAATDVRDLLEHAAQVAVGVSSPAADHRWSTSPDHVTPLPRRAGLNDVRQLEHLTASLRELDLQYGGGACRDAVLAHSRRVRQLLHLPASDEVRRRLHLTVADLHNLAGWTSFDVGLTADARRHFALALTHAREAGEPSLVANVLYRIGRLHLHARLIAEALRFFQLGQIAAQDGCGSTTVALLCANEAWAYGMLGIAQQAQRSLGRAEEELGTGVPEHPDGPWVSFGTTDLTALAGVTHLELAGPPGHLEVATTNLSEVLALRGEALPRSRAFELSGLATALIRNGDTEAGISTGRQAVQLAGALRSARVWDRLQPLASSLTRVGRSDATELRDLITISQPEVTRWN